MKKSLRYLSAAALFAASLAAPAMSQTSPGTAITYQGRLELAGVPVNSTADLQFRLFDAPMAGDQVGLTQSFTNVSVVNGAFTKAIDFGADAFNGSARWLEVAVRSPANSGNYVILTPRQSITPAPYALKVPGIDGHSLNALDGSPMDAVFVNNVGDVGVGTTSPLGRLDVRAGNSSYFRMDSTNGDLHVNGGTDAVFGLYNDSTSSSARTEIILNNQPHLVVNKLGGVGIGTTTPARRLSVLDGGIYTAKLENTHPIGAVVEFRSAAADTTWELGVSGTQSPLPVAAGSMYFFRQGHTEPCITVDPNGLLGVGTPTPGYRLDLPNIASVDGRGRANRWDTYSSIRWKDNVRPLENALDSVLQLRGVSFDWKAEHGGGHEIGFVAEEVGAVVPELVTWEEDGKDAKGLAYDRISALTVEAIKEQQRQIEALQASHEQVLAELAAQQEASDELRRQIAELAARLPAPEAAR